ncbi:unnamed protein product [Caenorhabditis bovis]|uniref:Serpentine receptor class r-10 n=1 Tax=Caenorhabditis bovis TaxID=2654633 RepID=A0A8S1EFR6_9PELO|nr:unnamed protein product [Caenorhabditis bovis]
MRLEMMFVNYFQYGAFGFSQILNWLLLCLIIKFAGKKYGSYKYLMVSYSIFSLAYSVVEVLSQPIMSIKGAAMILFINGPFKDMHFIGDYVGALYCSSFGCCISLLAVHFVYRYLAICRPNQLHQYEGNNMYKFIIFPSIIMIIWFVAIYVGASPSPDKADYIRSLALVSQKKLSGFQYYNRYDIFIVSWMDFIGCSTICAEMALCNSLIIFCGIKIYRRSMQATELSAKTKDLNSQLFKVLLIQTIFPLILMFIPVALFCILPIFQIEVGSFANAPGFTVSVYPGVDALVAILMIRDFRHALFFFYCASFALCISLLSSHFVFRYIAICKSNYLHHISGFNLYKMFLASITVFIIWFSNIYASFWPSEIKSAYLYNELMEYYNVDSYQIGHICELYFYYTKEGELVISWMDYFGGIFAILIISICVIVILICGFKTYSKMQSYTEKSKKTKDLNNQLFRALILQTIVPALMMFAPVGAVIFLPMSGINLGTMANFASLTAGFYPAFDAIIVICVIKDYRQTILGGNKARVSSTMQSSYSNI